MEHAENVQNAKKIPQQINYTRHENSSNAKNLKQ